MTVSENVPPSSRRGSAARDLGAGGRVSPSRDPFYEAGLVKRVMASPFYSGFHARRPIRGMLGGVVPFNWAHDASAAFSVAGFMAAHACTYSCACGHSPQGSLGLVRRLGHRSSSAFTAPASSSCFCSGRAPARAPVPVRAPVRAPASGTAAAPGGWRLMRRGLGQSPKSDDATHAGTATATSTATTTTTITITTEPPAHRCV